MKIHLSCNVFHIVLLLIFSILSALTFGVEADETSKLGNFKFLAKPNDGYFVQFLNDIVEINCSTNDERAETSLFVKIHFSKKENAAYSRLINGTLRKENQDFVFIADPRQSQLSFSCMARLENTTIWAERGTLLARDVIRVLPVQLVPNVTEITLEKNSNFEISCQAPGKGVSTLSYIKWLKRDSSGLFEVDPKMVHRKGMGNVDIEVLRFKMITRDFQGTYICQRKVGLGPSTSASFKLTMKNPEKPFVSLKPNITMLDVLENTKSIVLKCLAIHGSPKPVISWYKGPRKIKSCSQNVSCSLEITKPKYQSDDGVYNCIAVNTEGNHSASLYLTVLVPVLLEKPRYTKKTYTKIAGHDETYELHCVVKRANPLPRIIWRYRPSKCSKALCSGPGNGWTDKFPKVGVKPDPLVQTNFSALIVPPSTKTGQYSCQAINPAGADFFNITLQRKVPDARIDTSAKKANHKIVALAVSCSAVVILLVLLAAYCYSRRLRRKYARYLKPYSRLLLDEHLSINEQSDRLTYESKWEFPRDKLQLLEPIGRGAFGEVWLAKAQGILEFKAATGNVSPVKLKRMSRVFSFTSNYHNFEKLKSAAQTTVAVKTLKENATETEFKDLASELKILIHIGEHQNIVNLLGACTRHGKLMVILEYCPYGDLSTFLRTKRSMFEPSWIKNDICFEYSCTLFDLANVTYQIARGMDYLSSKKCIHRDLAARNILVSKDHNQDYVIKIADFGMARDIYKDGIYEKESSGVLPLKWTAPESLADAIYTSQSDVWSFGVVLWEIFTLGGSPYPGITTDEFLTFLNAKKRMEKPECCPDEFYDLMRYCWDEEPECRPTFSKILDLITDLIERLADTNATYLRLESGEGKSEGAFPSAVNEIEMQDEADGGDSIRLVEMEGNKKRECSGYENLRALKNEDVKKNSKNAGDEYVPMVNGTVNDENSNLLS